LPHAEVAVNKYNPAGVTFQCVLQNLANILLDKSVVNVEVFADKNKVGTKFSFFDKLLKLRLKNAAGN
jgi:hypothetical protein